MTVTATLVRRSEVRRGWAWTTDAVGMTLFLGLGIGIVLRRYVAGLDMPGDLGDPRFTLSMLEFFYRTLLATLHGGPASEFLNAPFFYPWPGVTNFADTYWGDAWVYAFARGLGVGQLRAFQIWFIAGFALTYAMAFVSLRKFGLASWGAAAGSFLFVFALPMITQSGHPQLIYRLWVPPAVLALDRFLTRQSLRAGAACILFIALQLAVGIYLGLFLCLLVASYALALLLVGRDRFALPTPAMFRAVGTAELVTTGVLLLVGLILLVVVALPYSHVQSMYGSNRSWSEVFLPRPGSYLLAGVSTLWPNLSSDFTYPYMGEMQLFPGLSAIIPFFWFTVSRKARARQPLAAVMAVAVVILFAFTINLGGHTLYRLIYLIPGFSAIRAIPRVILVMMLPLATLFGLLVDDLAAGPHRSTRFCVALALCGLLVAECSLVMPYDSAPASWQARLAALKARLPSKLPDDAILAIAAPPLQQGDLWSWLNPQIDAEIAAVTLGINTLNGYSGYSPPTWRTMTTCDDVGHNIRAGEHFLSEHGLPEPDIQPEQIVLVGFGACDTAKLGRDPVLQLGRTYRFLKEADGNAFADDGFAPPESSGRWTNAKNAFLFFSLAESPPGPITLEINASTLSPAADRRQKAIVKANGRLCGSVVLSDSKQQAEVTCPAGAIRRGNNMLLFRVWRPTRPIDLGLNRDKTHRGIGLRTVTLLPHQ